MLSMRKLGTACASAKRFVSSKTASTGSLSLPRVNGSPRSPLWMSATGDVETQVKETEPMNTSSTDVQSDTSNDTTSLAAWVGGAAAFGSGIWLVEGPVKAQEYFAGYLLEQSLSIDNLFVFILVFNYFKCPFEYQPKVLNYGIYSAAALRLVMILLGVELIEKFEPALLIFAGILLFSSYQLLFGEDDEEDGDLENNSIVKLCKQFIKTTSSYDGDKFFTVENGVKIATPLLLVVAVIELSDIVFAVDSIPAVFGVTRDPFIVYSSNMFAILSLRALFGFVSGAMAELKYLDKAVALVLGFIGMKMVLSFAHLNIPTDISLEIVAALLGGGVAASLWLPDTASAKSD